MDKHNQQDWLTETFIPSRDYQMGSSGCAIMDITCHKDGESFIASSSQNDLLEA
jgi:hypothetical protein